MGSAMRGNKARTIAKTDGVKASELSGQEI